MDESRLAASQLTVVHQAHALSVRISDDEVAVQFGKRAHNPLLVNAGFAQTDVAVPWWGGRRLKLSFG